MYYLYMEFSDEMEVNLEINTVIKMFFIQKATTKICHLEFSKFHSRQRRLKIDNHAVSDMAIKSKHKMEILSHLNDDHV